MDVVTSLDVAPTALWLLRRRLLALSSQLGPDAPAVLQALRRQAGTTASTQLLNDLRWAWKAFPRLRSMQDPGHLNGWRPWLEAIVDKPNWKNTCLPLSTMMQLGLVSSLPPTLTLVQEQRHQNSHAGCVLRNVQGRATLQLRWPLMNAVPMEVLQPSVPCSGTPHLTPHAPSASRASTMGRAQLST